MLLVGDICKDEIQRRMHNPVDWVQSKASLVCGLSWHICIEGFQVGQFKSLLANPRPIFLYVCKGGKKWTSTILHMVKIPFNSSEFKPGKATGLVESWQVLCSTCPSYSSSLVADSEFSFKGHRP